jgi:hypothetical protein
MTAEDPFPIRVTQAADGRPAVVVGLALTQDQADALNTWFVTRAKDLKGDKWKGWCEVDMAMRTLCAQIDGFYFRAFGSHPK